MKEQIKVWKLPWPIPTAQSNVVTQQERWMDPPILQKKIGQRER
jgi:hypothetical protein